MRKTSSIILLFLAAFCVADWVFRCAFWRSRLPTEVVDIQTEPTFQVKLDALARHNGLKVVLLGDSLIVGETMKIHGDALWRQHTLDAILEKRLRESFPQADLRVFNLGLNGCVPADLQQIVERLGKIQPDLVIMDVNLRSFSSDFAPEEERYTRSWLHPEGDFAQGFSAQGVNDRVEAALSGAARSGWSLYAVRDQLQAYYLGGNPKSRLQELRGQWEIAGDKDDMADVLLLMKAKKRYDGIHLDSDNPQRLALEGLLSRLRGRGIPCVVFYAREEPNARRDFVDDRRYERLREQLSRVMEPYLGDGTEYLAGCESFLAEEYLDHVHVDAGGYEKLADYLWPSVVRLLEAVRQGRASSALSRVPLRDERERVAAKPPGEG
jgi:hypothetical protein